MMFEIFCICVILSIFCNQRSFKNRPSLDSLTDMTFSHLTDLNYFQGYFVTKEIEKALFYGLVNRNDFYNSFYLYYFQAYFIIKQIKKSHVKYHHFPALMET